MKLLNAPESRLYEQSDLNKRLQRKIIFLSARGGTGKSNFIANIAASLALKGLKIGIVDLDIKGPCLETIFNTREKGFKLNDFLLGRCSPTLCVIDLAQYLDIEVGGLFLLPASLHTADILATYEKGYSVDELTIGLTNVAKDLKLNLLLVDTHAGLDEDTLISMLMGDHAIVLSCPDRQNRVGTVAILNTLRRLGYGGGRRPISLIINKVPPTYDLEEVKDEFEEMYGCQVLAAVPFYIEVLTHMSDGVFFLKEPYHPFSTKIIEISEKLLNCFRP